MNILITSGAGYISSALTRRLVEVGHRVVSIGREVFGQVLCFIEDAEEPGPDDLPGGPEATGSGVSCHRDAGIQRGEQRALQECPRQEAY